MQGLPLKSLLAVVGQLLLAVSALHENGIIHRDIKVSATGPTAVRQPQNDGTRLAVCCRPIG